MLLVLLNLQCKLRLFAKFTLTYPYHRNNRFIEIAGPAFSDLPCFFTLKKGVAGRGERLPSGKHRFPLPLEGVCRRRVPFAASGRGKLVFRRFPHQGL